MGACIEKEDLATLCSDTKESEFCFFKTLSGSASITMYLCDGSAK